MHCLKSPNNIIYIGFQALALIYIDDLNKNEFSKTMS
jgi:hypothetical protein